MAKYRRVFENGYSYFLTVVTYQRNPILIDNVELLRKSFQYSKAEYQYSIDAIVILPEHFHIIITPKIANEYSLIIKDTKSYFSKYCDEKYYNHLYQSTSRIRQGYKAIWQKRFYEHTIRDEKDYKVRLDYIHFNSIKHKFVDRVKDWKYSSFDKFVNSGVYNENWGDFNASIDFE